jgi:hypothetical protein
MACSRDETFDPTYPESLTLKDSHLGSYSGKLASEDKDIQGTQFQTNHTWTWGRQGSGYRLVRTLDTMQARGYHKNSMPNELEHKVAITQEFGADLSPLSVQGYDSLHTVLKRIPQQKEEWRTELLRLSDTVAMQAFQKDLWRLFGILPKGQKVTRGQRIDIAALNQRLETFKADSAFYQGRTPRLRKNCLDIAVYYHREDSLVLLREQYLMSNTATRKLRTSKPDLAKVAGTWLVSVDLKTGLPCYWSLTEVGDMTLKNSAAKTETPIQLIRFEEDVVQF